MSNTPERGKGKNGNPYDNELLAAMRDEEKFVQDHMRGQRMVKLERGHVWTVRFLPVRLPGNTWFLRIAKHWLNKKPIVCPKDTAPSLGGDPECYCPCCETAAEVNRSSEQAVSDIGWETRANSQWLTYCIVRDKNGTEVTGNEMLMAYEFWHYVNTWEELKGFWKAASRNGKNLTSVLDYATGNDFAVSKTAKGTRLDKLDSEPIFDNSDEAAFEGYIAKIVASVKPPKVKIPTQKELEMFAEKIQEEADKAAAGGGSNARRSGGGKRPGVSDDEVGGGEPGEETDGGASRPRRPGPGGPAGSGKARPAPPQEEEDNVPMGEEAAEAPVASPKKRPVPVAEEEPEAEAPARPQTTVPKKKTPPPAAAEEELAPEPAEEEPTPEEEPVAEEAPVTGNGRVGPRRVAPIAKQDKIEDDPEELPEEKVDSAPAVKRPLKQAVEEPAPEEEAAELPAPSRKLGAGIGSQLRDKIKQATNRED